MPVMATPRTLPVVLSVVVTEAVLAILGSQVSWQVMHRINGFRGVSGLLLRSVGAPWSAPWHGAQWSLDGPSTSLGLVVFLALIAGATAVLTRGVRGDRVFATLVLGIWASSLLALALSQILRLLVVSDAESDLVGNERTYFALAAGSSSVYHAVFFGWVAALVGAAVAVVDRNAHSEH